MVKNRFDIELGFYESLAKLFYCVLLSDNNLNKGELERLNKELDKHIVEADKHNLFSTQQGNELIGKKLGELIVANTDVWKVLDEFKAFKIAHEDLFTDEINAKLWKVVNALAFSTAGKNKSEIIALNEISLIFKQH